MMKRIVILLSIIAVLAAGVATAIVVVRARAARLGTPTPVVEGTPGDTRPPVSPETPSGTEPKGILSTEQDGPLTLSANAQGDTDSDGLINGEERQLGTDPARKDTDGDGLSDREEVRTYCTNPLKAVTDGKTQDRAWVEAREREAEQTGQRAAFCVE